MAEDSGAPTGRFWRSDLVQNWLARRMPPERGIRLHQGNIFILPTREGLYFTVVMLLMVLAGINYQNSLVFALAFMLVSLFMVSILHTFRNLSGLVLQGRTARPAFAGEDAEFNIVVSRQGKRTYEALVMGWDADMMQEVDLIEDRELHVRLFVPARTRGRFNPGRVLVQTNYPVGLFRAWSWVDLNLSTVVYPRPVFAGEIPMAMTNSGDGESITREGADDFHGLRDYRDGDPLGHVAWKSYARTEELQIKEYAAYIARRIWLDWNWLAGLDRENRLSRLCYWVLAASRGNDEYGLRLPGVEIAPARGAEHRQRLLEQLALFETST